MKSDRWLVFLIAAASVLAGLRCLQAFQVTRFDDFELFYHSGFCLLSQSCDRYAPFLRPSGVTPPNLHPPFAQWLYVPLAWLPIRTAYLLWVSLSVLSVAASLVLIGRHLRLRPLILLLGGLLVLGSAPAGRGIWGGQVAGVLLLPLTWLWLRDRDGKASWGWLGPLIIWKPFLALFAVTRRRAWMAGVTAAMVVAGDLALEGPAVYRGWIVSLSRAVPSGNFADGSLWQVLARSCRPTDFYAPIANCGNLMTPLWIVFGVAVCLWTHAKTRTLDPDRAWLLILSVAVTVSPKGWIEYSIWAIGPAAAVFLSGDTATRRVLMLSGLLCLLPVNAPTWGQPNPLLTPLWGSLYLWVRVGLIGVAVRAPARRSADAPSLVAVAPDLAGADPARAL